MLKHFCFMKLFGMYSLSYVLAALRKLYLFLADNNIHCTVWIRVSCNFYETFITLSEQIIRLFSNVLIDSVVKEMHARNWLRNARLPNWSLRFLRFCSKELTNETSLPSILNCKRELFFIMTYIYLRWFTSAWILNPSFHSEFTTANVSTLFTLIVILFLKLIFTLYPTNMS